MVFVSSSCTVNNARKVREFNGKKRFEFEVNMKGSKISKAAKFRHLEAANSGCSKGFKGRLNLSTE